MEPTQENNLLPAGAAKAAPVFNTLAQTEQREINRVLLFHKGNITTAAKILGIGRATLYRKVKQYRIDIPHLKGVAPAAVPVS